MPYDHQAIEKKWQKKWEESGVFKTNESPDKKKFYALDMFPYPSGAGLHVGHPKGYIATDVVARFKMMQGFNVLHPMGWDAFGLPAENYAIKNKVHPSAATAQNIETFKKQLSVLGFTYDWDREVNTTDPKYYKWTQWAFLQMFKKGLAYESYEPINWCPSCQTGLANEDLDGEKCERCGSLVEQKPMRQWVLKITEYAERLLKDLSLLPEWPESIKQMQREWIGRSEGALIKFQIPNSKFQTAPVPTSYKLQATSSFLEVFTTRPDTLFGATYIVLSPEHELISKITTDEYRIEVEKYIASAKTKTDIERGDDTKEKTGVFTGAYAINPVNREEIPIWVADYVLAGYGTGAIMAVPAHDERDFAFAKKFNLPIKQVVAPHVIDIENPPRPDKKNTQRNIIHAIVLDPTGQKFIALRHKTQPWLTPITGGIEDGEDFIQAAGREIKEETGFTNFEYIDKLSYLIFAEFFAAHKDVNRAVWSQIVKFKLTDLSQEKISTEEEALHTIEWLPLSELSSLHPFGEKEYLLRWFQEGETAYVGDGVLVNSDFLNDLPIWKATDDMISWLEENDFGQRKVQYKLRDWVFSRQRYWGEPIPLIHCNSCKSKIEKEAVQINFRRQDTWGQLISGQKTIETRVLNPEEPEKYFGNVGVGKYLCAVNKVTGEEKYFKVVKIQRFGNLEELVEAREFLPKIWPDVREFTLENRRQEFAKYAPDYLARIEKNGLIAWQLEMVTPGIIPVPESELPLELPQVEHYEPSGTGESPLATIEDWVNTKCPICGELAKRETNTMPQWAGSCWYYLRYCDPKNNVDFFKDSGFKFRPAIQPTEMDKKYFEEFKKIYSELENQKIKVWTGNRFLLNGLNGNLWVPFRTICLLAWEDDRSEIENYLIGLGYKLIETHTTNYLFEKDSVRVEIVAIFNENGKIFSWSYKNARQEMTSGDLQENELGHLWGFSYRIVSPEYNLRHYKYINEYEKADRSGLGDDEKIAFLQAWVDGVDEKIRFWQPVDLYVGGAEHATRHLIYARFWHKFLYDLGVVSGEEPFMRLQNVGLILAEDGRKMSKRWGNVINPDDVVKEYGADALRVYEMFMGPFNQPAAWSTNGLVGTRRFLEKVNGLLQLVVEKESNNVTRSLHQTIKKVSDDINEFRFNTAVAQLMTFVNIVGEEKGITRVSFLKFLRILCPFAPHLTNELATSLGEREILETSVWPSYDPEMLQADKTIVAIQVNGKLRGTVEVLLGATEDEVKKMANAEENVKKYLAGKEIVKVIFVKGKLMNIVVK